MLPTAPAQGSRDRWWALAAAAVVFLGLSPALFGRFGFSDDYTLLYQVQTDPADFQRTFLRGGRPLGSIVYGTLFGVARTIDHLGFIRLVCALSVAASAAILTRVAQRYGYRRPLAFLLGASLVVLPSTIIAGTWAAQVIGGLTLLVGLVAGTTLAQVEVHPIRSTIIGCVLLCAAVCMYQPGAVTFWLVWLIWMLSPSARELPFRSVMRTTSAFLFAMGLSSGLGLLVHRIGSRMTQSAGERAALNTNVLAKVKHVVTMVWPRIANPWGDGSPIVVACVVAAALILALVLAPQLPITGRLLRFAAVLATLFLGYAPNFATSENWISSRSMIGVMPILPICVIVVLGDLADRMKPRELPLAPMVVGLSLLGAAWTASYVFANIVVPQERELEYVTPAILDATQAPSVAVLPSSWTESFATFVDHDEVGLPSTAQDWAIVPLTELVYREKYGTWHGQVHLRLRGTPTPATEAAVLDFAVLLDRR
jgi:hypothetical protein